MSVSNICIKGARVNNLKNIDVEIPRNKFVVITGLSGSGKSSLAFDTLYAEGRRRYVVSLSAYARQFFGKMQKPECDFIRGLPPAIAIEQKVSTRNPRSTVGTSTEIYDYIRMLFGRIGHTYSPVSGKKVVKHSIDDVLKYISSFDNGTRVAIAAPIIIREDRNLKEQLEIFSKEGYTRVIDGDGNFIDIDEYDAYSQAITPLLLIDRLVVSDNKDEMSRMSESIETAFFEGNGECVIYIWSDELIKSSFSKRFEEDGIIFREPSEQMFNFNNPLGACPVCEGFGMTLDIAENLVVPQQWLSIYDGAVAPWRGAAADWRNNFIANAFEKNFPVHTPYNELSDSQKRLLWDGDGYRIKGINDYFDFVRSMRQSIEYRMILNRYRGRTICRSCHGSRLRPEASYVKIGGITVGELVSMPVSVLYEWFEKLQLDETDSIIARRLLVEIKKRLIFLIEVGLGYLTLDRVSNTLSGGESQRINLATSLGSSLVGSLYILDEPSIGLHSRDTNRLINVLKKLRDLGNTVVVVEHDEDIMRAADYIIDVGPDAGRLGGEIVYSGSVVGLDDAKGYTAAYLTGKLDIQVPESRRPWRDSIIIEGATEHNLKNVSVKIPLSVMTVVTGVSGSGKSTLVRDIFYKAMVRRIHGEGDAPGMFKELKGDIKRLSDIVFVDQNPIGRSTRSNPATYLKAYDEIRVLMASQQAAKQMGYTPAHFSFNTEGGRCEACKGEGKITIEMQFLADVTIECEECGGKRFQKDVLQIEYKGKNIYDILEMTVDEAIDFFGNDVDKTAQRVAQRLQPLQDVGLGYIKLGQSSSTLSGGENQRVKLAYFLSLGTAQPTLFIFDEPTTGLHFHDIKLLLVSFDRLIKLGHTLVIIEHNLDVVKCADHIIDLGPDGGNAGGYIVAEGTPEEIAANTKSITGHFLKEKLGIRK